MINSQQDSNELINGQYQAITITQIIFSNITTASKDYPSFLFSNEIQQKFVFTNIIFNSNSWSKKIVIFVNSLFFDKGKYLIYVSNDYNTVYLSGVNISNCSYFNGIYLSNFNKVTLQNLFCSNNNLINQTLNFGPCLFLIDVARVDLTSILIISCFSNIGATGIIIKYPNIPQFKYTVYNLLILFL